MWHELWDTLRDAALLLPQTLHSHLRGLGCCRHGSSWSRGVPGGLSPQASSASSSPSPSERDGQCTDIHSLSNQSLTGTSVPGTWVRVVVPNGDRVKWTAARQVQQGGRHLHAPGAQPKRKWHKSAQPGANGEGLTAAYLHSMEEGLPHPPFWCLRC